MNVNDCEVILGIDPGTVATGYAFLEVRGGSVKPLDFGVIRPKKGPLSSRQLTLFESIEKLLSERPATSVAVENQFVHKNPRGALTLGMARGLVLLAAARRQIPVFQYAPSKVKLTATGSGRASKDQVVQMIKMRLNLSCTLPEDAADACAVALCHIHCRSSAEAL